MNKQVKRIAGFGVACLLLLIGACWYAVTYNDSRLVVPMEEPYEFKVRDLPMHIATGFMVLYAFYLIFLWIKKMRRDAADAAAHFTRRINPKCGLLGFAGLLGFMGFWTYRTDGRVTPFMFFMFFGFFGFFYEGKMSHMLMDERYEANKCRALMKAHRAALDVIFATLFLLALAEGRLLKNPDVVLMVLVIAVACSMALDIFLGEYLLYRYDHGEQSDESGE